MSEKLPDSPVPVNEMTFKELSAAQKKLRDKGRPTIPYIEEKQYGPGYKAGMEVVALLRQFSLEGNINVGLGGVTIFVDNEADLNNLKKFSKEHNYSVRLPKE